MTGSLWHFQLPACVRRGLLASCLAVASIAFPPVPVAGAQAQGSADTGDAFDAIQNKLRSPVGLDADKMPLDDFIAALSRKHSLMIQLDQLSLKRSYVDLKDPVTLRDTKASLNLALVRVLSRLRLEFQINDGKVVISGRRVARDVDRNSTEQVVLGGGIMIPLPGGADAAQKLYGRKFLTILRLELDFAHAVCKPTDVQRKLLEQDGEKALSSTVKDFIKSQQQNQGGGNFVGGGGGMFNRGGGPKPVNPRALLRDAVAKSVKERLTPEQTAQFQAEVDARAAGRKDATIRDVATQLDKTLLLSADQRANLCESLDVYWNDSCGTTTFYFSAGLPMVPDECVMPYLRDPQARAWKAATKSYMNYVDFGLDALGFAEDEEPAAEAAAKRE